LTVGKLAKKKYAVVRASAAAPCACWSRMPATCGSEVRNRFACSRRIRSEETCSWKSPTRRSSSPTAARALVRICSRSRNSCWACWSRSEESVEDRDAE
jgi:hypothetical protein